MAGQLMQEADSLGIFEGKKAGKDQQVDLYTDALRKIEQEVAKVSSAAEETKTEE